MAVELIPFVVNNSYAVRKSASFFFFLFSSTLPMSNQTSFLKFTDLQIYSSWFVI